MAFRLFCLISALTALFTGCSPQQPDTTRAAGVTRTNTADEPAAKALIKPFFQRYKGFLQRNYPFRFVIGGLPQKNSFLALNAPVVAAYVDSVRACGPVSPAYLNRLQSHFHAVGDQLLRNKQNEGEVAGLDYDAVFLNADNDDFYATLDTAQVRLLRAWPGRRLYAVPAGMPLMVQVRELNRQWQLDSIDVDTATVYARVRREMKQR